MKKSLRIASILLALVLVTSCFVGGTFAKYVTSNEGKDSARVAKWGVEIEAAGTAFSDSYKDIATTWTEGEKGRDITVQSKTAEDKVVAPGTNGTLATFKVTGAPEVDTEITYNADLVLTGWGDYCPLIFTVNGKEFDGKALGAADLETAVEAEILKATAIYDTNTDLSTVNDDLAVTWAWPYSTSDENDVKDTALGNAAADGSAATIDLTVGVTVTQVD